eukprot:12289262-Heterocapsa_arctica.AAC.1
MSLDSKAFSRERALIFHDMTTRGWSSVGAFAFSCSASPGATGETDKFFVEGEQLAASASAPVLRGVDVLVRGPRALLVSSRRRAPVEAA